MVATGTCPHCGAPSAAPPVSVDMGRNLVLFRDSDAHVSLTPRETELMFLLVAAAPGSVTTRRLIERMWGASEPDAAEASLKVFIGRARRKVRAHGADIKNAHSVGYYFVPPPARFP